MNRAELAKKEIEEILKKYDVELCVNTSSRCSYGLSLVAYANEDEKYSDVCLIDWTDL